MKSTRNSNKNNLHTEYLKADIVVIGAGGAGLPAAVSAAEAGVKNIIVLEKAATPGGSANFGIGVFAVNSPTQEKLGIQVSADRLFREKMELAAWRTDPMLVRTYINKTGDIIRWLESKGLEFKAVISFQPEGERAEVMHKLQDGFLHRDERDKGVGVVVIKTLIKECEKHGIKILYETPAKKIILDNNGAVSGVIAQAKDRELNINTRSVIIATGSFVGNKKIMKKYFPEHLKTWGNVPTTVYMTGDGMQMADEIGAIIDDQLAFGIMGPNHYPWKDYGTLLLRRPHVMMVNKFGERYGDESITQHFLTLASNMLTRQPDQTCYGLIDTKIKDDMIRKKEIICGQEKDHGENGAWLDRLDNDLREEAAEVAEKKVKIADSWDEIAKWIGTNPEVLKATIERYNSFCDKGYDADFLKEPRYLLPLRKPPYYAITGHQGYDSSEGGIRINHRMEVINKKFNVIPGAFAVGDNAGSWASADYPLIHPGTSLAFAYSSGFIAGENAAKYISQKK